MPGIKAAGIILKQTEYGEGNRMLSIFTKEFGIISASAYGVKSMKSAKGAVCQFLNYAEFELIKKNSDIYTVITASSIENFYPVSENIEKLSLAVYLCDVTYCGLGRENADERILSLLLNTLYIAAYTDVDLRKIKCIFELKFMSLLGYHPMLSRCVKCASSENILGFSPKNGGIVCKNCAKEALFIDRRTAAAITYILKSDGKAMYNVNLSGEVLTAAERISEKYIQEQLDIDLQSLLYFKNMSI